MGQVLYFFAGDHSGAGGVSVYVSANAQDGGAMELIRQQGQQK